MDSSTTRRSALGILATGPIAMLPALAVMQCSEPVEAAAIDRLAWDRAIAAYNRADRFYDEYKAVCDPVAAEMERRAPWAPLTFKVPAATGYSPTFRFDPTNPDEWDDHVSLQFREAAMAVKTRWLHREAVASELGITPMEDELERLAGDVSDAEWEALKTPAPDHAALLWKIERLYGTDDGPRLPTGNVTDVLMADARRLLAAGRA